MRSKDEPGQGGQSLVEYALLLTLVALVVLAVLLLLGPATGDLFDRVVTAFSGEDEPSSILTIAQDFMTRLSGFEAANGRWPRSWGDYRFTDIGLDPSAWAGPVAGVYWNPNGDKIGLANRAGDNLQVYVDDLEGNRRKLYDGWSVWCVAESGRCYYHTVAPGNEVDLATLTVVEE